MIMKYNVCFSSTPHPSYHTNTNVNYIEDVLFYYDDEKAYTQW
jgi:hypothetical protein